jgi:hypothetical protein
MFPQDEELQLNYYCAAEVIRTRVLGGRPIPRWLHDHYRRLDARIVSRPGREIGIDDENARELFQRVECAQNQDLISAAEAALIIGCSKRQATRIAVELGGRIIGGRWMFDRETVLQHAKRKAA